MKMDSRIAGLEGIALSAKAPPAGQGDKKVFCPRGSLQPIEKAQNGQGNPRKSKLFSLIHFAPAWLGFAGF
jgi:hypothetical protein